MNKTFNKTSLLLSILCLIPTLADATNHRDEGSSSDGKFCTETAVALFNACGHEVLDDYFVVRAICTNFEDDAERAECFADAEDSRKEENQVCREQRAGRLDACKSLGEDRYDPDFDPEEFDDDFKNLTNPNRYFPLDIGNKWEYRGGGEVNKIEVLNRTKLIDGVTCIVVRDIVREDGRLKEATDDWFAQSKDGNVWYCGEEVKDYESFEGDKPMRPELVSIDGSFKAGRDDDKPGIIFRAKPKKGEFYIEEFSLGNAEDVTEILSTNYSFGSDPELDQGVPPALAQRLCFSGNCVVTRNFSLLEPGIEARKYYAVGIGFFLEVESEGLVIELVNCNFDNRCANLPPP